MAMEYKQDALLAAVMRASLDCIVVIDEDGLVVDWNPASEHTFGYARDDAIRKPVTDLIIPKHYHKAHQSGMTRYLGGGEPRVINQRIGVEARRSDGTIFPVELAITEVEVDGRRLFMASLRDLTELYRTTAALEESEAKLSAFFEHAPASMFIKGRDGRYENVNAYTGLLMGRPAEEIIGRTVADVFPAQTVEAAEALDRAVLETGEAQIAEQTYDVGEIKHTVTARFPIRAPDGSATHIGVVIIDISDRVKAENKLRDSEARLSAMLDHAPMTMYLKDRDGHYCIANRFMAEQVGMTSEELLKLTPRDLLSPASADEAAAVDQIIMETGQPDIRESEFQTVEGIKSAMTVRFPVFGENDEINYIGGIFLDTSEQRRAQRRFRALSEHHPVAMLIASVEDHRILLANPAFFKLIGLPQDSDVSMVSQFRWLDDPEEDRRFRAMLREHDRFDGYECRMRRAEGSFWCSISWRHIDFDGERALVFSALNIADKKNAEAELERSREALHQSEKMNALGSLLAGVSHELNNPLAIVVGEAILLEEEAEGTPLAGSAGRIKRAAERCSRIVQTFLAMARQKPPERKACAVNELIEGTLELADYGLRSNGIEVVARLAADLPPLWADPDQVSQVLLNLIINAQQALQTLAGPRRLTIESRLADDGRVAILVADNGPGVPADVARRIFDPFFTTKPQGSGTGIGLSFSLGIAQAHGGTLQLLPSDSGATFELLLPSASATEPEARASDDAAAAVSSDVKRRALVVDDEPDLAQTLAGLLQGEGFDVAVAVGGAAAIDQLQDGAFDVVLSDLRMPGVDGPELYAWVRAERPDLADRIGFVTGDTLGPAAVHFLQEADRPYIEKPFTRAAIRSLVGELTKNGAA
jgi:PAS domain S-box-containing protein